MILISTPMYGGFCQAEYFLSCLDLERDLTLSGIPHEWDVITNESLIQRGRNNCVAKFLESEYSHHLFIDGDIQFSPSDVAALWNLDKDIAVGAYSRKKMGETTKIWSEGKERELTEFTDPVQVDYAGTGFMMIKRQVYERLIEANPDLAYDEGSKRWALFDCEIDKSGRFDLPPYLSEDYLFCQRWKNVGGEIWCDPSIKLVHWGRHGY